VLTFGGINLINFPSGVVTLPILLTTTGFARFVVDPGIEILIGFVIKGELLPTLGTVIVLEVVGTFVFFVEKDAAVSRSFPPPERKKNKEKKKKKSFEINTFLFSNLYVYE
jgi:hypothetical protein